MEDINKGKKTHDGIFKIIPPFLGKACIVIHFKTEILYI